MRLQEIIDIIKKIGGAQPNVNSSTEGSIYEVLNTDPSVDYANFHVTQNKHTSNNQFITYNFIFFYTDRLMDDKSNKLQIQSIGIDVLNNILRTIQTYYEDVEVLNTDFQPFTERFSDNCAGVFSNVSLIFPIEYTCEELFINSISTDGGKCEIRNEYVTVNVTENGQLTVNYGPNYTGLERVVINTNVPQLDANLGLKTLTIDENTITYLRPEDDDLDGYDEVRIITQIPQTGTTIRNQNKTLNASNNGSYNIKADNGYTGLGDVTVNVNVPQPECDEFETENITITENGVYTPTKDGFDRVIVNVPEKQYISQSRVITISDNGVYEYFPTSGADGITQMLITVDVPQEEVITSGVTLTGAIVLNNGRTAFLSNINLKNIGDIIIEKGGNSIYSMFNNCTNLETIGNVTIPIGINDCDSMFKSCKKLKRFNFDESWNNNIITLAGNMFYDCESLTDVDMTNFNTQYVLDMGDIFYKCKSLTNLKVSNLPDIEINLSVNSSPLLTVESLLSVLNALPNSTNGYTFRIGSVNIAKLTPEQIAIATNKGWILS